MTKSYCDRCGVENSHNQEHVFAPGYYAGTQHVQTTETKKDMGKPHVLDMCKVCEQAACLAFDEFMVAVEGPRRQAAALWAAEIHGLL